MSGRFTTTRSLLLAVPAMLPVVVVLLGSLTATLLQSVGLMPFIGPASFTLEYWTGNATELARTTAVSLYIAGASTLLACIVGFIAASYILMTERAGRLVAAIGAATIPIPHLIGAGAVGLLLADSGFLSRLLGLSDGGFPALVGGPYSLAVIFEYAWKESAFVALVIVGSLARSAGGLCETAATLGATPRQRITHVVFPLALPALAVSAVIVFVYTLGSYEVPWLLGAISPEVLPVRGVRLFGSIDLASRPEAMVTALLSILLGAVAILMGLVLLRRIRSLR
ncbi:ABC transporter permease subunit [Arthrobacter roseus]|uniref:ABC transporter permease subunit n=1 Tax=Arthrobacter roseus TaxID=136274 RepID=UPI0019656D04|nr:ABC transporter permease subunit [Arthrobacter roseus]MBM7846825.1 putative spermidine/putrescine transport system permease protein [Arthrobacter roseus]